MERETINRIEILDTGELLLGIESQGQSMYQYIYREASGIYWDQQRYGFKSTPMKEWPCSKWFIQIVGVVKSSLGVELNLSSDITWINIPVQERAVIENGMTI